MVPKKEPSSPGLNDLKEQPSAHLIQISQAYHARRRAQRQARQEAGRRLAAEMARRRATGEPLSQPETRTTAPRKPVARNELKKLVIVYKEVDVQLGRTRSETEQINRVNKNGAVQKASTEKEGGRVKGGTKTAVGTKRANVKRQGKTKKVSKTKSNGKSSEKKGKKGGKK